MTRVLICSRPVPNWTTIWSRFNTQGVTRLCGSTLEFMKDIMKDVEKKHRTAVLCATTWEKHKDTCRLIRNISDLQCKTDARPDVLMSIAAG